MSETWLIVKAQFPNMQPHDIIRNFVKPIIDQFQNNFSTFHFFFEPYLLLRIRANEAFINQQLLPYIKQKLSDFNVQDSQLYLDPNYAESSDLEYGRDGWEIAQKIFELESRIAILVAEADKTFSKGSLFYDPRFVHLLVNQLGYLWLNEVELYIHNIAERLTILFAMNLYGDTNLANKKFSSVLKELRESCLPEMFKVTEKVFIQP